MTTATPTGTDRATVKKRAWRDWLLLSLTGLLTVGLLLAGMELTARKSFSRSRATLLNCLELYDPTTGVRGLPNRTCREKWEESPYVDYRLNACGDRTDIPCGPKRPGTYRIALLGSSIAAGLRVSQEATFSALLPAQLSAQTGRKVELYSLAMRSETPHVVDLRFTAALAKKPDLILWVVNPYDIAHSDEVISDVKPPAGAPGVRKSGALQSFWNKEKQEFRSKSFSQSVLDIWNETRMSFMIQHFLYRNQDLYVNAFLRQNDPVAGYLRTSLSPAWQENLRRFNIYLTDMQTRAHAAGVPLVVALVPARVQAGLLSMTQWPAGSDPYTFDRALRPVVLDAGAIYIDTLPEYRNLPHAAQNYFPVETHPTEKGHRFIAMTLDKGLTSGVIPELTPSAGQSATPEHMK